MAMNLEIGTTVGDYQIIGILGAGGMGKVYKVRNVISDRVEAMKVLLPDLATEPELADRFIREIKVQASLEHPNIAALHTALRVENQLLMLMEFVEGMSLDQKLKAGPLAISEAVEYVAQVLGALGYAHQHGVIHRDIKPANMMLTPAGMVKLMDFGIAKAATDRKLTMTGTTLGSLYYMSPEQIKGATTLDARSDLYSIGVTLYELVTGKRPFDGDSQFAIMAAHLEKNPIPPVTIDPRLPAELNDVILRSVAKEPGARFQTAEAFRNALLNVQGIVGKPAGAMAASAYSGAAAAPQVAPILPQEAAAAAAQAPAGKSHRGLWLTAGALCMALLVVGIVQFGPWKKASAGSAPQVQEQTATAPAQQAPPLAAPVSQPEPAQVPAPALAPAAQAPAQAPPAVVETKPASTARAAEKRPASSRGVPAGRAVISGQAVSAPALGAANASAPPAAQPSPAPQQAAPAAAAPSAASRAELQQVRETLVMVAARATTARNSLQTMQRSQAASSLNLRGDIVEAQSLAASFLDGAKSALEAGDAASARSFVEKAERQVEKIEKFLGR